MRVAAVQMRSGTSIAQNCVTLEELVRDAASKGATYIQTPEMTGIVQKNPKALFSEITSEEDDDLLRLASSLADELNIWLHIGSHAVKADEHKAANRAFVYSPSGECVSRYDKIHMFDVDLDNGESWRESKVYQPGSVSKTVHLGKACLGLAICYDLRFPHLYRGQALAGAQILSTPAAFTRQTGKAHWHILLRARAIENGAFMIAAAQGGDHDDGRETYGHSLIVNPWGDIVAEQENESPGVIVADIDIQEVVRARQKVPNLANSRHFVLEPASQNLEAAQ